MTKYRFPFIDTLKNFLPLKEYYLQNRCPLVIGLISLLFVDFLQLLIPLVIKKAIDALTMKTASSGLLLQYGTMIITIAFIISLFRYIWRYFLFGHSRQVEEKLRNRLYEHLQKLSFSFYQRIKTGDLMARAINDLNAIRMATGIGTGWTIGGLAGIAAFLHGQLVTGRASSRIGQLGQEIAASGGPPSPAQLDEMGQLQAKIREAGLVSAILLAVSVLGMSIARYLPW